MKRSFLEVLTIGYIGLAFLPGFFIAIAFIANPEILSAPSSPYMALGFLSMGLLQFFPFTMNFFHYARVTDKMWLEMKLKFQIASFYALPAEYIVLFLVFLATTRFQLNIVAILLILWFECVYGFANWGFYFMFPQGASPSSDEFRGTLMSRDAHSYSTLAVRLLDRRNPLGFKFALAALSAAGKYMSYRRRTWKPLVLAIGRLIVAVNMFSVNPPTESDYAAVKSLCKALQSFPKIETLRESIREFSRLDWIDEFDVQEISFTGVLSRVVSVVGLLVAILGVIISVLPETSKSWVTLTAATLLTTIPYQNLMAILAALIAFGLLVLVHRWLAPRLSSSLIKLLK